MMAKLLLHHILGESNELREASLFSPCGFDSWSVLAPAQQNKFRAAHAPRKTWALSPASRPESLSKTCLVTRRFPAEIGWKD